MRSGFLLSFATIAIAAPASLGEWGHAITRLGSWVETVADGQFIFGGGIDTYDDTRTMYDMLKDSKEYTRLMKWVNMNKDVVDKLQGNRRITFFAPNNDALPNEDDLFPGGGGEDQDRRRKEYIREMLLYSILPEEMDVNKLSLNSTVATELHAQDGSFGGRQRRIKIEPSTTIVINNYVKVTTSYRTKNGIVHAVNNPLYVPPDIMDSLYLFPKMFAAASVSFLKTGLEKELEFNSDNSKDNKHRGQMPFPGHHGGSKGRTGSPATTVFVPTNDAFNKLPNDLITYLFSPIGENTLRKLMEFHTIPDYVLYSEWIHHVRGKQGSDGRRRSDYDDFFADEDYEFHIKEEFSTLCRQKLPIEIRKSKSGSSGYKIDFKVHGLNVENKDNVAQNGAIHVIGTVLCPRHRGATDVGSDEQDWKEWRKWLVEWSKEN